MAGEHRALLIGVHRYGEDSGFHALKGPPNDLRGLCRVLRHPAVGLFTVKEPLLNPSTGELRIGVGRFLAGADRDDHLLLYYSGHGETSRRNGQLCLTSAEGDMAELDGSSLTFDDCYRWIRDSPARSVTVILDCCRSGIAFKGGTPDISEYFDAPVEDDGPRPKDDGPRPKMVKILTAGSGFQNARDAESDDEMSPFTARLVTALAESAEADAAGLVSFDQVVAAIRATADGSGPLLHDWGTGGDDGPYLAQRPNHAAHALERAGLKEMNVDRSGAAYRDGQVVHVPVDQVEQAVGRLTAGGPTTAFVSGPVGSGKTWILCDVRERLAARGWQIRTFLPSREPDDAHKLLAELKKYATQLRACVDGPCLLVIDGIEWSDVWAEFVAGLHDLTEHDSAGVSVLASLEIQRGQIQPDHEHRSWRTGGGGILQSVTGRSATEFIARILSPTHNPNVADWDAARLDRARTALQDQIGTDLWAAARLGPLWHDPDAEEQVIRAVWDERIAEVTPHQVRALHTVAALSRFNLWCPLVLALDAGDLLVRLGAEYSAKNDSVRLNSGFLSRSILARRERDGTVTYSLDRRAADPVARRAIAGYVRTVLLDVHRQQEVVTTLNRLRYDRRVFTYVVRELSDSSPRRPSAWDRWADDWSDLAPIVRILSFVRAALPPAQAGDLGDRFCRHVVNNADDNLGLPTVVAGLELLRNLHRGRRRPATLAECQDRLTVIAERQLAEHRWPAGLRRRLLRILRRTGWLDEVTAERVGPLLLRPSSPPVLADLVLAFDYVKIVSPGRTSDTLRAALATWDVVTEDLVRAPEDGDDQNGLEQLAVRSILARHVFDEEFAAGLDRRLKDELRTASAGQLDRMLTSCARMDRRFTAEIAGTLDVDTWSTTIYRSALPLPVAQLVGTLGKVRPDLAVRTLYRADGTADTTLAESLAGAMRADGDAVSASMLLKTAAGLEEQRGVLDGGFTQQLATALGSDFLADTLAHNNRLTIVNHLIEGFARSRTTLLESVRDEALQIMEDQIEHSGSENGARLALILSDEDALGESFVTELRTRGVIRRTTVLARMLNTHNPGALAAYHELGVVLFPGIEIDFAGQVEESARSWTETRMFDNLAGEGNVILALRAAKAVTATLVLSGRHAAGSVILDAYQRAYQTDRPGQDWASRVFDADDIELAEGLRHLHALRAGDARRITEGNAFRLSQVARRSSPTGLADLIAAMAEISTDAGERLVTTCADEDLLKDALDDLEVDGDLFVQAAALAGLADAEDRLYKRIVPAETAERFRRSWIGQVQVINNPGLVQKLVRVAGNSGRDAALAVARAANIGSLERRLDRRNLADAAGFAQLVGVLAELTPDVLPGLISAHHARWLGWKAPINTVARLAETMTSAKVITPSEVETMLSMRLNVAPDQVPRRHRSHYWLSVGWAAWTAARLGRRLRLVHPLDSRTVDSMVPHHLLWALTWFEPDTWMQSLVDRAFEGLDTRGGPPGSPAAAAAVLTVCAALDREPPLYGANSLAAWQHALDAEPQWVRALLGAVRPGSRLSDAFGREWAPWGTQRLRARLTWQAHDWRQVPTEALSALTTLSSGALARPSAPKPKRQSLWQRAE